MCDRLDLYVWSLCVARQINNRNTEGKEAGPEIKLSSSVTLTVMMCVCSLHAETIVLSVCIYAQGVYADERHPISSLQSAAPEGLFTFSEHEIKSIYSQL